MALMFFFWQYFIITNLYQANMSQKFNCQNTKQSLLSYLSAHTKVDGPLPHQSLVVYQLLFNLIKFLSKVIADIVV